MPGTNEYSMAPEYRAGATETTPTLITKPKLIGKSGNPNNTLPQIYTVKAYDPTTFDETAFADNWFRNDYGSKASKRDTRAFNKFKITEEYTKALAEAKAKAKADFDAAERQKWSDSYAAYSAAIAAQHRAKVQSATSELKDDITKLDMNPKPKWSATRASVDSGTTTYKVQAGNTLGQIVADYNKKNNTNLKWQDVAKWSGISDPSKMRIGHVINFVDPATAKVAAPVVPAAPAPVAPANPVATATPPKAVGDSVGVVAPPDTLKGP